MTDPQWTPVAEFPSLVEAELAAGRLESAGIGSRIDQQGNIGLFGPGHSGSTVSGVRVLVLQGDIEAARMALDLEDAS